MLTRKRIKGIFAAGVTGGHIYPALAVAQKIEETVSMDAIFIGVGKGAEPRIYTKFPYKYMKIHAVGSDVGKISYFYKNSLALFKTYIWLKKTKPDFVFTTGGYIGGIVGYAAHLLKIPLFLHESNADAGISNKKLSQYAVMSFCAFESTKDTLINGIVVGTPVRNGFSLPQDKDFKKRFPTCVGKATVLVFGGSEGSNALDSILRKTASSLRDIVFFHIGKKRLNSPNVIHFDYFEDMPYLMRNVDALICRAGASTIAEIVESSTPAILIPWRGALNDHQKSNARYLEDELGAFVADEDEMNVDDMIKLITKIVEPDVNLKMSSNLKKLRSQELPACAIAKKIIDSVKTQSTIRRPF